MTDLPGVLEIERATLTAVPAPRTTFVGPFAVRAFLGGTGRANAATSLDPSADPDLDVHVAEVEAMYGRAGMPPRFRSTPLDPPGLAERLQAWSYAERDESCVICGPIAGFAADDPAAEILDSPTEDWMGIVATAEYQTPARRDEKARMPELLLAPAAWVLLRVEGRPAATAFIVAGGRLAGLFDLAVRPEFRRRGLGRRVIAAAGAWAAARGAGWVYAQVTASNTASLALNHGLGLRERYRYRYWLRA